KSQNGGPWSAEPLPPTTSLFDIAFSSSSNGWALGEDSSSQPVVLHTKNGGATWSATGSPVPVPSPNAIAAVAGAGAWVVGAGTCGFNATIAKTTDGASWITQLAMAPVSAGLSDTSFATGSTGF